MTTGIGIDKAIADTLNDILELNERSTHEIDRIATVVRKEGKLNQRAQVPAAGRQWTVIAESVPFWSAIWCSRT